MRKIKTENFTALKVRFVDATADRLTGMVFGQDYNVVSEDSHGYFVTTRTGVDRWFKKDKFEVLETKGVEEVAAIA